MGRADEFGVGERMQPLFAYMRGITWLNGRIGHLFAYVVLPIFGYSAFSGVSLVGNYDVGGGGGQTFWENTSNYNIVDKQTVESPISVSGLSGNAPSNLKVDVNIVHTYKGDLIVNLVAPDGSTYLLHNGSGGGTDNVIGTYTVNASSESANGTWKLRVYDRYNGDTGYINEWSLQF